MNSRKCYYLINNMSTQIIALGTGSAFTMKNFQTNYVISRNGKNLLIDCGTDIRFSLQKQNMSPFDIDSVFVSHAHADHVGGLEYLAFVRYFSKKANPKLKLPKLFCEHGMISSLWNHTLRGGLESLEGIDANIDTYFDVEPVKKNSFFEWEGLIFHIVQALHITAKYSIVPSFGLMFSDIDNLQRRIFITTDVQFAPETSMKAYYNEADLIIHDCETLYKSGVHAHFDQLCTLPTQIKNKMLLTHYQDNVLDDFNNWNIRAWSEGFIGFAKQGVIYSS